VTLKPRIDIYIAMILAGCFFALVGFVSAYLVGFPFGLVPVVLSVLGLGNIVVGTAALWHRSHFSIIIDSSGITVPTGNVFRPGRSMHIPRDLIATIAKDESIRGSRIAIALRVGGTVPIQARHYCELKKFIAHCKAQGLPTA
jgi:hypothetical protein